MNFCRTDSINVKSIIHFGTDIAMPTHMDVELGERVVSPGHQGVLERDSLRHEQFERDVVRVETGRECLYPMDPVPRQRIVSIEPPSKPR